ncbi:hypothetical protein ES703_98631 [subsurface metagenome]
MFDDRESFLTKVIVVTDKAEFVKETFGIHDDIGDARDYGIYRRAAVDIHLNLLPIITDEIPHITRQVLDTLPRLPGSYVKCQEKKFTEKIVIMGNSYQIKTANGYDFFEVSSAFQKAIRRGDEDEVMFWAVELHK